MDHFWIIVPAVWIGGGALLGAALYFKTWLQERGTEVWEDAQHRRNLLRDVVLLGAIWPLMLCFVFVMWMLTYGIPFEEIRKLEASERDKHSSS